MRTRPPDWQSRYDQWLAAPQTVVVQPTIWCNLDCRYCYLPHRKLKRQMPVEVARAVSTSVAQLATAGHPVGIVWHGGEGLTVGPRKLTALLAPFEDLRRSGRVHHYVQTNATLITDGWCDVFAAYDMRVGVSIDGPAPLNVDRVDLRGQPAFNRIRRGIERLRERAVPFSVIAVINARALAAPEELLDYLADLGCQSAGLNIEEAEGVNVHAGRTRPTAALAAEFWRRTLTWVRHHEGRMSVREVDRLADYLWLTRSEQYATWEGQRIDPIPTVSVNGDVVLLSPELADTTDAAYDDFLAGNILNQSLADIVAGAPRLRSGAPPTPGTTPLAGRHPMHTRTIRGTSVTLPSLDEPGLPLSQVDSLGRGRGKIAEFHYADADLRALDLTDTLMRHGRISGLRTQHARLEEVHLDTVEFTHCDFARLHWSDSKLSRTVFRDCKLLGATWENLTLNDVLFENCKLDYGVFTRVRSTGPVIFSACSLGETVFAAADLREALFDGCALRLTEFDGGNHRGLDLRGNDLSQIRGLSWLKRIVIDQTQTLQLTEALTTELDITFD